MKKKLLTIIQGICLDLDSLSYSPCSIYVCSRSLGSLFILGCDESDGVVNATLLCVQQSRVHLLDTEKFEDTFGPKKKRRRPKLAVDDYAGLVEKVDAGQGIIEHMEYVLYV